MFNFFKKKKPVVTNEKGIGPEEAQTLMNAVNDIRSRISQAVSGGYDFADTLHNIYLDFGYPQTLDFFNFWNMYRRFGIAKNVVELPTDITWMRTPAIESDSAQFLSDFEKLEKAVKFWIRVHAIDKRQRVGRYAGMFMRVRDGLSPEMPISKKLNGVGSIVQMVPLYESQLKVIEVHNDPKEENYGLPKMYQFSGGDVGSRSNKTADNFNIHPDRIVIVSEDADNGGIYGIPALEACYNSLMDLRKILGGGGEGFYKNAAQNIVFDLKEASSANANQALLEKFNENYDEFARNRFRRAMWTPGMEAKTLEAQLLDPKEFFFNSLYDVAASSKIPATVLIGQQTGRLASSQDSRSFLSTINSRRENFGTEFTSDLIDWCIEHGVLPSAEYTIEWDDLLALSQGEQLDNAEKMSSINDKQFKGGGDIPFDGEEIREAAGFEPREDIGPGDEIIEDDDE